MTRLTTLQRPLWAASLLTRAVLLPSRSFRNGFAFTPVNRRDLRHGHGHKQPTRPPSVRASHPNIVVGSVIAVCVGIYGWQYSNVQDAKTGSPKARQALADYSKHMVMSLENFKDGRYYTILTATFAHANLPHLLFNMMTLWSFGRTVVGLYGLRTFAIIWVGAGLTGGIAQLYFWSRQNPNARNRAVGASGSILGLLGTLACVIPYSEVTLMLFPMTLRNSTLLTIGLSLAAIHQGWLPWLGHVDHLGGLAFGAFWYLIAIRRGRFRAPRI